MDDFASPTKATSRRRLGSSRRAVLGWIALSACTMSINLYYVHPRAAALLRGVGRSGVDDWPRPRARRHGGEGRLPGGGNATDDDDGRRRAPPTSDRAPLLLEKTDSIYREYNHSMTPIVIPHYKLLFFTIEKTGSTVLKQLMRRMTGHDDYYYHGGGIPHIANVSGLTVLTDYSLEEANEMMTSDEWTRAMFVRDPKERCLSGYLMWRPRKFFPQSVVTRAQRGQLNKSLVSDSVGMGRHLGKCCKEQARGDVNYEVLCWNHMQTFDGFLSMIGDPSDVDGGSTIEGEVGQGGRNLTAWSDQRLRASPPCLNQHWSPVTRWRLEPKFWRTINFVGHLETARHDAKRLLDRLHPDAWERFGASGWGEHRNESMFESAGTVRHAVKTEKFLSNHFQNKETERRVERIYMEDYENAALDLELLKIGESGSFYRKRFTERFGHAQEILLTKTWGG
ncbi:hypothetical protein ACHAWF_018766 [Thalassiosira exigua]